MSEQVPVLMTQRRHGGGHRIPLYAQDWLLSEPVKKWRARIAPGTFPTFYSNLWRFLTHIHKTPDEAIQWAKNQNAMDVLDVIQGYVLELPAELRYKTKFNVYEAARSFFQHNRVILPVDPSFQIRSDTPPVGRNLSLENLAELIRLAPQPLRSILLVKWMALTDTEGIVYISNHFAGEIVHAINEKEHIVRFAMPGRKSHKNQKPYFTYIGKDALDSLKECFERTGRWPKQDEPVWISEQTGKGITKGLLNQAWLNLLRRAKLIPKQRGKRTTRYGYGFHNNRDIAISLLSTVPNLKEFVVEFWAGHDIDPNQYKDIYNLQPQFAEKQYELAEPYLNILTSPTGDQEIKAMAQENQELRQAYEELKKRMDNWEKVLERKVTDAT